MDTISQLNTTLADRYRIEREIGQGGMATVFLARDLRHDRNVALKVLKPELAAVLGAERFVQEIKTTASLQHPHILPLFDSGTADGFLFYVMPFIDGETLRQKLDRETQLGVDEAVRIARDVADALDYAHHHGVIHRDIKPENILIHDGRPMVADFGIALAVSAAAGGRMTETGLSLGTPHYMSPEQATAEKEITARSDVYSLGSVLYEMLTGNPPHTGASAQQIIMKIIAEPVAAVTKYRKSVPPNVAAAVAKSLEKLPADRFESAKAFGDALGNPGYASATVAAAPTPARIRLHRLTAAAGFALAGAVAVAWWVSARRAHESNDDPVLRLQLVLPKDQTVDYGLTGALVAISPQGDRIAYEASTPTSGGGLVWLRPTDQLESRPLTSQGGPIGNLCFSPDGRWVAFTVGNDVRKIAIDGGPAVTLATLKEPPLGLSWGTNGSLVAGTLSSGLFVIPERGGAAQLLPKMGDEREDRWPVMLPDGKTIVYGPRLALASISDGRRTSLGIGGGEYPLAVLGGQLIYAGDGALKAVPFDGHRVSNTAAVPLVQDVLMDPLRGAKAAVSASGTLVYLSAASKNQPVIVHGGAAALVADARHFANPRFSPDAKRIALSVSSAGATDVWVYDRARSTLTKITSEGIDRTPEWSSDSRRLVFASSRSGHTTFWWQPADGSGPAELLYEPEPGAWYEPLLSPDGHWLVYRAGSERKPPHGIFAVPLDGDRKPVPLVTGNSLPMMPRLSPDGHWLAYQDNESGVFEIYVRPFPGAGARLQVSAGGGTEPLWAQSGRALYYRSGRDIVSVGVVAGTPLVIGQRKVVLTGDFLTDASHQGYDVSPDGSKFLMLRRGGDDVVTVVVHNWIRELIAKTSGQIAR